MGENDLGERTAENTVEIRNLKERVSRMEKGLWTIVIAAVGWGLNLAFEFLKSGIQK